VLDALWIIVTVGDAAAKVPMMLPARTAAIIARRRGFFSVCMAAAPDQEYAASLPAAACAGLFPVEQVGVVG
jgi:hypothetical protein